MSSRDGKDYNSADYIIVGAGSAGAVIAHRLITQTNASVILIEAGGRDSNPAIHIPFGLSLLTRFTGLNWGYHTSPQDQLNQRSLFWPRGKVLGGSSSINAMCYIRGDHCDYDDWAIHTKAEHWAFEQVLPYFKRAECNSRGKDQFHGDAGPLSVSDLRHCHALSKAWITQAQTMGLPFNPDFNALDQRIDEQSDTVLGRYGVGYYQVTHREGQRCSSAAGYLANLRHHNQLTLLTHCHVTKILIKNKQAYGVEIIQDGKCRHIYAQREVIISAGAINSPQLLMLSGIGNKAHLSEHGIVCVHDNPNVGQHLQDHLDIILRLRMQRPAGYSLRPEVWWQYIKGIFQYASQRNGVFSSNIAEAGGFAASRHGTPARPDLQFHFIPADLVNHGRDISMQFGVSLHICNLYPEARGEITLHSSDPLQPPRIDPKYLSSQRDLEVGLDAIALGMKLLNTQGFAKWQATHIVDGEDLETEIGREAFLRQYSETVYHPVGTCKMGALDDTAAVVDPYCQVIGIAQLRVVDASVMPSIVGGNTNAPSIMIAEVISDFIIEQNH